MIPEWVYILLGIIWGCVGLLLILKLNPEIAVKKFKVLLTDKEFVRETHKISHELLLEAFRKEVAPVIVAGAAQAMGTLLKGFQPGLPEGFWKDFNRSLNMWYANMTKNVNKEIKEVQNQAMSAAPSIGGQAVYSELLGGIKDKSPILGAIAEMAFMSGQASNGGRSIPIQSGGSGY